MLYYDIDIFFHTLSTNFLRFFLFACLNEDLHGDFSLVFQVLFSERQNLS